MIRRLSRMEVQMLIDVAVELGDVNYTRETPTSTDLTSVDWMPSTCRQHLYSQGGWSLRRHTQSETWWKNLVIVGVGVVFRTKWRHDNADVCRAESKYQRPKYGPLRHSTDSTTTTRYATSGRRSEMSWSTVSKAAVKSSSNNSAILPLAIASTISENTFYTAVSVEWHCLNADGASGNKWNSLRYPISWRLTILWRTFERNGRFETGR